MARNGHSDLDLGPIQPAQYIEPVNGNTDRGLDRARHVETVPPQQGPYKGLGAWPALRVLGHTSAKLGLANMVR